jgi:5-methylcytosine-specific restriction endonuclease McrA
MMGKRLPNTPRSKVRAAIRQLWLRSRERAAALKRDKYCCQRCGVKQSRKKGAEVYVEVHHKNLITNWEEIINCIFENVLVNPDELETLCVQCHDLEGKNETQN